MTPKRWILVHQWTKHLHFGLKSSLYSVHRALHLQFGMTQKRGLCDSPKSTSSAPEVCARLEISGQNTKKMARKCGGFRVKRCKTGPKSPSFWPRKPVAKRFSGLTCPIFRSRTAGIASRSSLGLRVLRTQNTTRASVPLSRSRTRRRSLIQEPPPLSVSQYCMGRCTTKKWPISRLSAALISLRKPHGPPCRIVVNRDSFVSSASGCLGNMGESRVLPLFYEHIIPNVGNESVHEGRAKLGCIDYGDE